MKPVFVVPVVDISWYTSFRAPVFVQKNYKKKFLCCNKINATLCIELEKAAFITGMAIVYEKCHFQDSLELIS